MGRGDAHRGGSLMEDSHYYVSAVGGLLRYNSHAEMGVHLV